MPTLDLGVINPSFSSSSTTTTIIHASHLPSPPHHIAMLPHCHPLVNTVTIGQHHLHASSTTTMHEWHGNATSPYEWALATTMWQIPRCHVANSDVATKEQMMTSSLFIPFILGESLLPIPPLSVFNNGTRCHVTSLGDVATKWRTMTKVIVRHCCLHDELHNHDATTTPQCKHDMTTTGEDATQQWWQWMTNLTLTTWWHEWWQGPTYQQWGGPTTTTDEWWGGPTTTMHQWWQMPSTTTNQQWWVVF